MDFKRIQVVLIIFFLIFDVYLVYMLFSRSEPVMSYNLSTEVPIEERLTERGISFGELNDQTTHLPFVVTQQSNVLAENISQLEGQEVSLTQEGILTSRFDEPVDLGLEMDEATTGLTTEQMQALNEFLSDSSLFINGDQYRNYWYINTANVIYIRMLAYDGRPIVDGSAEIRILLDENYMMTGYHQTYQDDITTLQESREIISQREAIEIIDERAQTLIPDNSIIHYLTSVYYRSRNLEEFSVYSPAWQLVYDNEEGRFTLLVDAVTGTVINQNQLFTP